MKRLLILLIAVLLTACIPCGCTTKGEELRRVVDNTKRTIYTSPVGDKVIYILDPPISHIYVIEDKDGNLKAISTL